MRLLLSMLGWPDGAKPELRETDAELAIGRGREAEWTLPDPANQLSRRHCVLTPLGEGWRVTDLSLNGTFINGSSQPLGRQHSHELHDGDRIRIGSYIIEARYQTPASLQTAISDHSPFAIPAPEHHAPAGGTWQPNDWAATPASAGFAAAFDPLGRATPDGFVGQPSDDHSPAVSDAWHAPPPARVMIPEDWDLEAVPAVPSPSAPMPAAAAQDSRLPEAAPADDDWRPDKTMVVDAGAVATGAGVDAAMGASDGALLAAFLRGVGLRDVGDADPVAMMEAVGRTLRVVVDRLREVQAARGTIKREFRILATVLHPNDNNPIRFSANGEAGVRSLLDGKHPPDRAVGEMLDGIRLHELAMIAAMRDAVRGLLAELDPAPLRAAAEEQGLAGVLPMRGRARAFEKYEALHARTVQALTDDFDSVFGKAFARAYERVALDEENTPKPTRR